MPATSIPWGPWKGVGMLQKTTAFAQRKMEAIGLQFVLPLDGLRAIDALTSYLCPRDLVIVGNLDKVFDERADMPTQGTAHAGFGQESNGVPLHAPKMSHDRNGGHSSSPSREQVRETVLKMYGESWLPDEFILAAGLDSVQTVQMVDQLSKALSLDLSPTLLYDYPTVEELTAYLFSRIRLLRKSEEMAIQLGAFSANIERSLSGAAPQMNITVPTPAALVGAQPQPKLLPRLQRSDYYCSPTLEEMAVLNENDLAALDRFIIGRRGIGEIRYLYPVDVRGIDLDDSVTIKKGSIQVAGPQSRQPGRGLNQPAILVFRGASRNIFRSKNSRRMLITRIRQACHRMGAKLLHVDEEAAEWMVKVDCF